MKTCFIDCETTGTNPERHGLIQIAGALFVENELREQFNIRMQPHETDVIEDEALAVNGVTRGEIETYQPCRSGYTEFVSRLGNQVDKFDRRDKLHFIGYNADFDADMVRAWFQKCGDPYFGSWFYWPILDLSKLAGIRLMRDRHTLRDFKLMTVAKHFGLVTDGAIEECAHNALFDIKVTMRLFKLLTKDLGLFEFAATSEKLR